MPEENKEKKQKKGWFLKARTRCRTIYWQNFLLTASVVMLTLALLGSAFFALTYSYAIDERSEEMQSKASVVSHMVSSYMESGSLTGLRELADFASSVTDAQFLICNADGNLLLTTDPSLANRVLTVPKDVSEGAMSSEPYAVRTTLGSIYADTHFVVGVPIESGGATVGFIANQPAKDEGRLTVYGCKKAARFAAFCDCFSIPVITVVDSVGMKISTAPQGELSRAGAQLLFALSEANTPRIALVAGQAIGMSYAALASRAVSDMVYAWPGSVFSPVTAPIAAQLLYADEMKAAEDPYAKRAELEQRYMDDVADAVNAAKQGYVDDVIEPSATRQMLCAAVEMLSGKRDTRPAKKHGNMPL